MNKSIEDYTEEELKKELLTLDFHGKEFKKKCLDELLSREYVRGLENGRFAQILLTQREGYDSCGRGRRKWAKNIVSKSELEQNKNSK